MPLSDEQRLADLTKRRDQLQAQIKTAEDRIATRERKRRTRRLILLGSFLDVHLGKNPKLSAYVRTYLPALLTSDRDRSLCAPLLTEDQEATSPTGSIDGEEV